MNIMYLYLFQQVVLNGLSKRLKTPQEWIKDYFNSTNSLDLEDPDKYFRLICEELYRISTGKEEVVEEEIRQWLTKDKNE